VVGGVEIPVVKGHWTGTNKVLAVAGQLISKVVIPVVCHFTQQPSVRSLSSNKDRFPISLIAWRFLDKFHIIFLNTEMQYF
jgi:hypothetical protein